MTPRSLIDVNRHCDLAIVGAGIVGLATARELQQRRPGARIVVLEREERVGAHQTGPNSRRGPRRHLLHAGLVEGAAVRRGHRASSTKFCERARGRPRALRQGHRRARPRGARPPRRARAPRPRQRRSGPAALGADELRELEPHARGSRGLHSPHTGIVDFAGVARALAAQLRARRGVVATGARSGSFDRADGAHASSRTPGASPRPQLRRLRGRVGRPPGRRGGRAPRPAHRPVPRRLPAAGPERRHLVRALIYPVPDPDLPFLGVHLTRASMARSCSARRRWSSARWTPIACARSARATSRRR